MVFANACFFLLLSMFLLGCGKKSENADGVATRISTSTVDSDPDFLTKQTLVCGEGESCPDFIAKIVAMEKGNPRICTGFLVTNRIVATSSSCLPHLLRLEDQDCSKDVFFFFAGGNNQVKERVGCSKVLLASPVEGRDALLWRDDVAYLLLDRSMTSRRSLLISRDGLQKDKSFLTYRVEQVDEKIAFVRKDSCEVLQNSYVNPLASADNSPMALLAACNLKEGFTGSPVVDTRGRVRAIVSSGISEKLKTYLETSGLLTEPPLLPMYYASNFTCAPTPFERFDLDDRECTKDINQTVVEALWDVMINRTEEIELKRRTLEEKVSGQTKFMKLSSMLLSEGDAKKIQLRPKCFKNVRNWINNLNTSRGYFSFKLSFPTLSLKRSMNGKGEVFIKETGTRSETFTVLFHAKNLRKTGKTDVLVFNDNSKTNYPTITECH